MSAGSPSDVGLGSDDGQRRLSQGGPSRGCVPAREPWAEPLFTVGVTGTNGKTSTTHLIAAIMRAAKDPVLCQSTLGYFVDGRPSPVARTERGFLSFLHEAVDAGVRRAVVEVTSLALQRGYAKRWRFDLAVFTNWTRDHVAEHGSWEHYLACKAQLFLHLGPGRTAVLNACDQGASLIDRVTPEDVERLWYAAPARGEPHRPADLTAVRVEVSTEGTRVELASSAAAERIGSRTLDLSLVGEVYAENSLAAALSGLAMGYDGATIRRGLAACFGLPGRFEILHREPLVVLDYAHTPDALARLCDSARRVGTAGRTIVVFGAGGGCDPEKRRPMGEAVGARADIAFITNDNPRHEEPATIAAALEEGCRLGGRASIHVVLDRAQAIERALSMCRATDVLVVAGRGHDTGMALPSGSIPYSDAATLARLLGGPPP